MGPHQTGPPVSRRGGPRGTGEPRGWGARTAWQEGERPPMPRFLWSRERGLVFHISDTWRVSRRRRPNAVCGAISSISRPTPTQRRAIVRSPPALPLPPRSTVPNNIIFGSDRLVSELILRPVWHNSASPAELFFRKQLHERGRESCFCSFTMCLTP
jgi:hypothetical protein